LRFFENKILKKIIGHAEDERKERVEKFTQEVTSQYIFSSSSIKEQAKLLLCITLCGCMEK
jgi:hypothetical protein